MIGQSCTAITLNIIAIFAMARDLLTFRCNALQIDPFGAGLRPLAPGVTTPTHLSKRKWGCIS